MEHLDLAGVITSTPMNWNLPLFDQQDAIYLSSSRQMLEPILEETSEDEEQAQNSWNPYEQTAATSFWSGSASESEAGSVIKIEINKDSDSISERDFACPAKRARRSDEFLREQNAQYFSNQTPLCSLDDAVILRRPQHLRPEFVSESSMSSLERFLAFEAAARDSFGATNNLQRSSTGSTRRFDDFSIDPDSVSYQSLSRSSSLIQFESLERQLQLQDQHVSMSSLGNSSPSVLSFDGALNTGSNSGSNSGNNSRRGSQSSLLKQRYESSDGRLHQTYYDLDKLNFDDDESCTAPVHKQRVLFFGGTSKSVESADEVSTGEAKSDSESSSTSSGSGNSVLNSTKPSAEDLSDAATSGKSIRMTAFQRGGKNSAENLSEDSGYCEPSNLRRSKSKSIPKNFEKFCEEEEEYGQFSYEHEHATHYKQQDAQITVMLHSKTNRDRDDSVDDNTEDNVSDDVCQPKINDVTFCVMESAAHVDATDRSATVILSLSPCPPLPPPPLETSFDALMYTNSPTTSSTCVKNSPTRDTTSTSMSVSIERAHRPIAHSPSPVASDISARSSTSTTPSTCASAASFTWYTPTQMQHNEASIEEAPYESERETACREFSSASFSLRNSLPDLREAYGSISENTLFFSNPQRPTNGDVLEHTEKSSGEETGGELLEVATTKISGRVQFKGSGQSQSGSGSPPTSSSTTPEHSDVTTDSPLTTPESTRRRRSVGVCSGASAIVDSEFLYQKRVSSVPSELHKVGRKKRSNPRHSRYNKTSSEEASSTSSETNSEAEDHFNVNLNNLRRCCSWSERRQKFQGTAKRRPVSLFGYMNASYQDLTQLDYAIEPNKINKNQALLKRASAKMSEQRKSTTLPDYEHIICKGNFLLDELSEIYDRNASILNDRPADMVREFDEELEDKMLLAAAIAQKPLHSPRPPPRRRKSSHSSVSDVESAGDQDVHHVQLTIRKPPARRRNKSNTNSLTNDATDIPCFVKTFDQDPTNLRTSYAQSLEKCNFDAKELSNSDLSAQQQKRAMPKRRFHSQANNAKKKNLVSSTPNLNAYDHGDGDEDELDDEIFVSSAHTSMHQLPQGGVTAQKPLGILLPAGSRTSFSKEVSFCPVVSKYSWQEQSSEEFNDQTASPQPNDYDEAAERNDKGDQMFSAVYKEKIQQKEKTEHNEYDDDDDDDDLLCNDIDATLAYNTKENEVIAAKQANSEHYLKQLKEMNTEENNFSDEHEMRMCKRFIEELREHELIEEHKRFKEHGNSTEQQRPTTPTTPPTNIVTSTKLVTSTGVEKTTTIITKRLMPSTSTEALATSGSIGALNAEVSHKTTFVSETAASPDFKTNEIKQDVSVQQNTKPITGHAPRPLSIQLPILSEPPVNRAHHILYASQQMLDNFQKREREAELQEQQQRRLKAVSANNLSGGAISGISDTMSRQSVSLESQNSMNNNNDLNKMKNKFKADEKHPNSKGFLSRFAHGFRFSLRRNKKKQLQKDQQQQNQEQQTKPEFVPELQFNVVKDNSKKEKETKSKAKIPKSNNTSKGSTTGKSGNSSDIIHIPLKGPLPAGSRATPNSTIDSSTANSSISNSTNVSNASTVNFEQSLQNSATVKTPTVDNKATISPTMKLVTGKPPLPKQPPPPRTSSLPQNSGHARHIHNQQQQHAPAVAITTSFVSKSQQPTIELPMQTHNDSCEDFLAAERSYYYDDFKNQLNSGMQANGCTLATAANGGSVVLSPSRASVSQKTQMFNNMQRSAAAPVSQHHNAGKIGLIETNLDTHETIITGKTRSLVDIGPSQLRFVNAGGKRLNLTSTGAGGVGGDNVLIYDDDDDDDGDVVDVMNVHGGGNVIVVKTTTPAGQIASVRRPHKSMEFLLDKENQKNVLVRIFRHF